MMWIYLEGIYSRSRNQPLGKGELMNTEEKLNAIMKIAEEHVDNDVLLRMKMTINCHHHDEWTAKYCISKMVPVCYVGAVTKPKSMMEWLDMLGVTPHKAYEMVYAHYDDAVDVSSKYGISAPRLESNMWDCWWCVAMMLSDYWITVSGDPDMAYQMAYEYLSDPDRVY